MNLTNMLNLICPSSTEIQQLNIHSILHFIFEKLDFRAPYKTKLVNES